MKRILILFLLILLWASFAHARQDMAMPEEEGYETPLEGHIRFGYQWVSLDGNPRAGEYAYLHSSAVGSLKLEWDPLPHRFLLETDYLNEKEYFGDFDYAYSDIAVLNVRSVGLYHNLDHYGFGLSGAFPGVSFTDRNPGDRYGVSSQLSRALVRFKTPNFPFHLYAEGRTVKKEGTVQQRFLLGYFGNLKKTSASREIQWNTVEATVGANSHLGPVEVDYSHREKRFEAGADKVMYDAYPAAAGRAADTYPHNLIADLTSSSDTVKVHTTHTGRLTAAATYSQGDKQNDDSGARVDYWNAAGDVTIVPKTNVAIFLKYRHYDLDVRNPATVTLTGLSNTYTYNVRDSISSEKDVLTVTVRYRPANRLTLKGELGVKSIQRDVGVEGASINPLQTFPVAAGTGPAYWEVAHRTTKNAAKLGATYRIMNRLTLRADYRYVHTDHPAYPLEPDTTNDARVSLVWTPSYRVSALLSGEAVREKRGELDDPLVGGGRREAAWDQALGSVTVMMGQRSSLTASYAYFRNSVDHTITYHLYDGATIWYVPEPGVPYDDIAHVGSLAFSHAYNDDVTLTAEASRSYARGRFRNQSTATDGTLTYDTSGIAEYSDLRTIESVYSAGVEMRLSRTMDSELRYQYRDYDDKLDNSLDGEVQTYLGTVSVKW